MAARGAAHSQLTQHVDHVMLFKWALAANAASESVGTSVKCAFGLPSFYQGVGVQTVVTK